MTVDKMMPPIPNSGTLSEIIRVMGADIVGMQFNLDSENPIPRLTIEFMRNVFWSGTFVRFDNKWHLQSFQMDASKYKNVNHQEIQTTIALVRIFTEGESHV